MVFTRIENGKRVCTENLVHPTQYHQMLVEAGFERTQEIMVAGGNLQSSYKGCISIEMIGPPLFPFDEGDVIFVFIKEGHRKVITHDKLLSSASAARNFGDEVLQNIRDVWELSNRPKSISKSVDHN